MLFGFQGISNRRPAYCIYESSFLIHHSLFLRPCWSIDLLEIQNEDETNVKAEGVQKLKAMLGACKIDLSPTLYWIFITDRSKAILLLWF